MINATSFTKYHGIFIKQFYDVLRLLIYAYNKIIINEIYKKGEYNEDILRNFLVYYARNYQSLFNLNHLAIHPEIAADYDTNFKTIGMCDIKIYNLLPIALGEPINYDLYYTIECKRLDDSSKLIREYVNEGVARFTIQKKYSKNFDIAGMIGFIEAGNITHVIKKINLKLNNHDKIISIETLHKVSISQGFEHSYKSEHQREKTSKIVLNHLLLDYSSIIRN